MLAADELAAYLARLGVDPEPPSAEALGRMHRAHAERVPFETAWIHMGERWGVDRRASVRRIGRQGRGGYCFHLNGALSLVLAELGYDVTLHQGGVYGPGGRGLDPVGNHLALVVHGLPTDEHPGGVWYVDVGLGDALHEPMPVTAAETDQGPFHYGLAPIAEPFDGWDFAHDPKGSFAGMLFQAAPSAIEDFAAWNEHLSTSPDSGFVRTITFQRRDAAGADVMRGLVYRRIEHDVVDERTLDAPQEWFDAIADVFGLDLRRIGDDAAQAALWQRVKGTHDAWLASQA